MPRIATVLATTLILASGAALGAQQAAPARPAAPIPARPAAPPACPALNISSEFPKEGATRTSITLKVTPPSSAITYNWVVSAGTIVSGQGTPGIVVQGQKGQSITASVEIGGGVNPNCMRTESETVEFY